MPDIEFRALCVPVQYMLYPWAVIKWSIIFYSTCPSVKATVEGTSDIYITWGNSVGRHLSSVWWWSSGSIIETFKFGLKDFLWEYVASGHQICLLCLKEVNTDFGLIPYVIGEQVFKASE